MLDIKTAFTKTIRNISLHMNATEAKITQFSHTLSTVPEKQQAHGGPSVKIKASDLQNRAEVST